jgi:penicillin-binding protein-related factor A (putative recombinase)
MVDRLTGSDFEKLIVEQNSIYEREKIACVGRYGVQSSMAPVQGQPGKFEPIQMQSLPDFEGSLADGKHIIFDAKVCSQASFPWAKYRSETRGARARQLKHMLRRSMFGAKCFFLMHWNSRELSKKVIPAATFIIPVHHRMEYWSLVESMEVRSLTLGDCEEHGLQVHWTTSVRGSKHRPDYLWTVSHSFPTFFEEACQKEFLFRPN